MQWWWWLFDSEDGTQGPLHLDKEETWPKEAGTGYQAHGSLKSLSMKISQGCRCSFQACIPQQEDKMKYSVTMGPFTWKALVIEVKRNFALEILPQHFLHNGARRWNQHTWDERKMVKWRVRHSGEWDEAGEQKHSEPLTVWCERMRRGQDCSLTQTWLLVSMGKEIFTTKSSDTFHEVAWMTVTYCCQLLSCVSDKQGAFSQLLEQVLQCLPGLPHLCDSIQGNELQPQLIPGAPQALTTLSSLSAQVGGTFRI